MRQETGDRRQETGTPVRAGSVDDLSLALNRLRPAAAASEQGESSRRERGWGPASTN
jgi:hypothetical protein